MSYRYYICDVFTTSKFGGNQLAVIPEATGLTGDQMQRIAREFNFSETTFVRPSERGFTRHVRIFTPSIEVPFAGHPNIGTAFVLAATGRLEISAGSLDIDFEEKAGRVPIRIEAQPESGGGFYCELQAPEKLSMGKTVSPDLVASALSLDPEEVVVETHPPVVASVGLPFLITELRDRSALERVVMNFEAFRAIADLGVTPDIHVYVRTHDDAEDKDGFDIRARMFAPFDGVPEDPATGSANAALAGLLAHHDADQHSGEFSWTIGQGIEMGRPSVIQARAKKADGEVTEVRVGGHAVLFSEGVLYED